MSHVIPLKDCTMVKEREDSFSCYEHAGHCARLTAMEKSQERFERRMEELSNKLNIILGAVVVLWPAIQIIMWWMGKK
jgi:hypothetical protein